MYYVIGMTKNNRLLADSKHWRDKRREPLPGRRSHYCSLANSIAAPAQGRCGIVRSTPRIRIFLASG